MPRFLTYVSCFSWHLIDYKDFGRIQSSGGAEQSDGRGSVWSRPGEGGTSFPELSWACTKSAAWSSTISMDELLAVHPWWDMSWASWFHHFHPWFPQTEAVFLCPLSKFWISTFRHISWIGLYDLYETFSFQSLKCKGTERTIAFSFSLLTIMMMTYFLLMKQLSASLFSCSAALNWALLSSLCEAVSTPG